MPKTKDHHVKNDFAYGIPPDLTEHMPNYGSSTEKDRVMEEWKKRRTHRQSSQEHLTELETTHDKIDAMLEHTGNRLADAHQKIGQYNVEPSTKSDSSTIVHREPADNTGKAVQRKKSSVMKPKPTVSMATCCTQTVIQGLDLEVIRQTADELNSCQESQERMLQYFEKVKERWVQVAAQTKTLQADYNRVVADSCRTCSYFQEELHHLSGKVAALQSQLDHSTKEKDVVRTQLTESIKTQGRLRLETEAAISREEATLNKVAFLDEEIEYLKKEVSDSREAANKLRLEYQKLEADRTRLMGEFVESRLKQSQVVAKYLDELQEREEERRELMQLTDRGSQVDVMKNQDRQTRLLEERNSNAEECEFLRTKVTAQDLHVEELQKQLADMAKLVDAHEKSQGKTSKTTVQPGASGAKDQQKQKKSHHKKKVGKHESQKDNKLEDATEMMMGLFKKK